MGYAFRQFAVATLDFVIEGRQIPEGKSNSQVSEQKLINQGEVTERLILILRKNHRYPDGLKV